MPSEIVDVGGTSFFQAHDGVHGPELWKSDGSRSGTVLVKDIGPEGGYDGLYSLTEVGGTLFFTAYDNVDGWELWKSDGSRGGTVLVRNVDPSYGHYGPDGLTEVGGTLFFTTADDRGWELWKSDGTAAGTVLVKNINPSARNGFDLGSDPSELTAVGDTLFFTADDGTHGEELWKSDGTRAGTVLVKDIRPSEYPPDGYGDGPYPSNARSLTQVGGNLFFTADDGVHGEELWKSDGTEVGTVLVRDIRPGDGTYDDYDSYPSSLTDVGGTLFFTGDDGAHGRELWTSDGTEAGTVLVKDIRPGEYPPDDYGYSRGAYSSRADALTDVGGRLFFTANDGVHGRELWGSDGTVGGTVLVRDIRVGGQGSGARSLTDVGGRLFFAANDGVHGRELWGSDGTVAGTVLVRDIRVGGQGSGAGSLTDVGGRLFFAASDGVRGSELWRSDGTAAGTVLVKDINAGGGFNVPLRGRLNTSNGTLTLTVTVAGDGRLVVTPVAESRLRKLVRDVASAGTTTITLRPTRAGMRTLKNHGRLRITARFTFTPCGGTGSSAVRKYTLRLR